MRHLGSYAAEFLVLLLIAGCGSGESAVEETVAASEPAITTVAPATTETPTTTAAVTEAASTAAATQEAAGEGPTFDEALAPAFVAGVREAWARAERTVGGTAPDLSDDEIVAVAAAMCGHLAANPFPIGRSSADTDARMVIFSDLAEIAAGAMGISYDPALQDAGFENGFDARIVMAFAGIADEPHDDGICPMYRSHLFWSPWSARASD